MRILLAALLLLPAIAHADEPAPAQGNADDCARARKLNKTCELTIGAEEVEGGVDRPVGSAFNARTWAYMNSLIHLRHDFIPEIAKSAEDI